ncbi:sialidase family protein [Paenibacillus thalictri]|uniref:exo-alpha-sialidase n=1 Tax=Paenibacillus thalictri TaxID=2527873 RepID=A0A4Q9DSP2_9BACL|nr:sialidase family protein [Paenibacillus thalictri]TBL78985.1 exo-alpha-sialidase [Paenibacillus thalictri]
MSTTSCSEPNLLKTDLFTAGEDGYILYRNPCLGVNGNGVIHVFCEARKEGPSSDWAESALVMRRSLDNGVTWEPKVTLSHNPSGPTHNAVAIPDKDEPAVLHVLYGHDYNRVFYIKTADDGASFSEPIDITYVFERFRSEYDWKVIATGIGHGIQLEPSGRLLVPVWLSLGVYGGRHRPSVVSVIYSDDGGLTWNRGEILSDYIVNPSETQAVQLADGSVLLNIRNESPLRRRAYAISKDGVRRWSEPQFDSGLYEPICCGSIVRYTLGRRDGKDRILFCNPDPPEKLPERADSIKNRHHLTVKLSYDECRTWSVSKVLEEGISGYSDLAVGRDQTILCAYNRGTSNGHPFFKKHVCVARFNLEWLTDGRDRLRDN